MTLEKQNRGILLKTGISRDTLVEKFISGMSLTEIGKKYKRTSERIWQIIRSECDKSQYAEYAKLHKLNRKKMRLKKFMAIAKKLGRVPRLKEAKRFHMHYHEFRKAAEESGYVYIKGEHKPGRRRKHSPQELLEYLKDMAKRLGHTPSCNNINSEGKFTHNMYVTCFGSLKKAQELAGLCPNKKYN